MDEHILRKLMRRKPDITLSKKQTLLAAAGVLLASFLPFLLMPQLRYYYWGDETRQVIPLTVGLYRDLHAGTFGTWNWMMSFGTSNAIQFLSYLGSPSFWLMMLLPKAEMIPSAFPIVKMLAMFLAAVFAYHWLSDLTENDAARFAGTMIMTFCGWAVFQQHYYSYLDAWMYLCLLLYIMEEVMAGRKKLVFPAVIALITILDLFTMYMASWLILFYMTTRLMMKGNSLKETIRKLIQPFLLYVLGLGMAGFVFLMDAGVLLASSRVNTGILSFLRDPQWLFLRPMELFRAISSPFSPVINDYDYNLFSSPFREGGVHTYALFSYSFILTPLLFPQALKTDFAGRKPLLGMIGFLAVCVLIPDAYVIFNGNTAARWCFILIVFHVVLVSQLIEHQDDWDETLLKRSALGVTAALLLFSLIAFVFHTASDSNRISILLIVPFLIALAFFYRHALTQNKRTYFAMALMAEALLCMYARMVNGITVTVGAGQRARQYETMLFDTRITDEIQKEDTGFYRISSDEETAENYLLPYAKRYFSSSSYFSLYNNPSEGYYHRRITENWFIPYMPSKFLSYSVFGNRYLIATQGEKSFVPAGYDLYSSTAAGDGTPVLIYRNKAHAGLGFASMHTVKASACETMERSRQDFLMTTNILTDSSANEPVNDPRFEDLGEINNTVLEHAFSEPGTLFIDYSMTEPYGEGSYELYRDGKVISYQEFSEYGFHAVHLQEKVDAVGIYTHNSNFKTAVIPARLFWISDRNLEEVYEELNALDPLKLTGFTRNGAEAEITVTGERRTVATAIAWNEGWEVYANGKKIDCECVNTGFIGFELDPGTWKIEFVFTPEGYEAGKRISAVSCFLYAVLVFCAIAKDGKKNRMV